MKNHQFKYCYFFTIIFLCFFCKGNAQNPITVFEAGKDGYQSFRIPAIIEYKHELLAFAEGRVHGPADFGDVDIVLKKSKDGGNTWGPLMVVASNNHLQAGNAAPVVDLTDPAYPGGRIFLFYNTGNQTEASIRKGNGLREVWYKTSIDGGNSWSNPVNITTQVHRPNQKILNEAYQFAEDWRSYANTPGHAIQIKAGKFQRRIFIAANHSVGEPKNNFEDYHAHAFYTDDHGASFGLCEDIPIAGSNEAMAVELPNSRIMMNIRNQKGNIRTRIIAVSSNGGTSWDTTYFDQQLPDPVCQGSILQLGNFKKKPWLAFCNPANPDKRDNLTLRISDDEGKTWKKEWLLDKNPEGGKGDYTAYSDLVKFDKSRIGVLYEKDNYRMIVFKMVKWK